jgi:hypothetical protein
MNLSAIQIKALVKVQQAYGTLGTYPTKKDLLASGVNGHTLTSLTESSLLATRLHRGHQVVYITQKGMVFLSAWESVIIEASTNKTITQDSLNNDSIVAKLGRETLKRLKQGVMV